MKTYTLRNLTLISTALILFSSLWTNCFISGFSKRIALLSTKNTTVAISAQSLQPIATKHFPSQEPASLTPMLTWTKVKGAVAYELELLNDFTKIPQQTGSSAIPFFSTKKIYVNGYNVKLPPDFPGNYFYWRVRGLNLDSEPISPFSVAEKVYIDKSLRTLQKPIITSIFNQGKGTTLLYPVYAWIPLAGAEKYEVEILGALPENPNGIEPSIHRIEAAIAFGFDYYDENPRIAEAPFYWRVRGLDQNGNPVGVYSDAGSFTVKPSMLFSVATYGDSITHGGGSLSYSPADWEYSYQYYLDFPSINLGRSGDTSTTMITRFEQDVLPFHPRYLIILSGTNSLRGGEAAEDVIAALQELKEKCLSNNILPVFLTIPPINPDNIQKAFDQETVVDWQQRFRIVNAYIRTQVHIDIARETTDPDGLLPTQLAVDGLHLDIDGKKKIAAAINARWPYITTLPPQSWAD